MKVSIFHRKTTLSSPAPPRKSWAFGFSAQSKLNLQKKTCTTTSTYVPVVKPRPDYKFISDNAELLEKNCKLRNVEANVALVKENYKKYCEIQSKIVQLNRERNEISKDKTKIAEGKEVRSKIQALENELNEIQPVMEEEALKIPNLTHEKTPGPGIEKLLSLHNTPRQFDFEFKDHLQLGKEMDAIDFESGSVTTGEKFYYLKNEAALLEMALVNWAMDRAMKRGYTPVLAPDLIRPEIAGGCGFQPRSTASQVYSIEKHPLCLTGTAEIPLASMYTNQIIPIEKLPIKLVAFGHCFRIEVGSRGSEVRGLYRVHQFSKVEMFSFATPEKSDQIHEEMLDIEKEMYSELGLHFRVLDMPVDDLGAPAIRKFDIEAWMPSKQKFGEISSTSNCTDYQARRLNIRYRNENKQNLFVHTINGTACAVPRIIISIMENFQNSDGSVDIPKCLHPFMLGGITKMKPKKN